MRTHLRFTLGLLALTFAAMATLSGLNNIPTADTTPQGTFVLQGFTTIGNDRDTDFNLGFKTGLNLGPAKLELGLGSHLLPDKGGPVIVHGKLAYALGDGLPTIAVGAANSTFSHEYRDRAGDEFFYAVISHDFGWLRVHGGCADQDGAFVPFFGVDKTFRRAIAKESDGKTVADGKSGVRRTASPLKIPLKPNIATSLPSAPMPSSKATRAGSIPRAFSCRSPKTSCSKRGVTFPTTMTIRRSR